MGIYKKICKIMGMLKNEVSINDAEKEKVIERKSLSKLNLKEIIVVPFPDNQYKREVTDKNQIVLHHTVSGQGATGDIAWWRTTVDRVGTAMVINWDGKIYQCFSSKYWAWHLGLKTANNKKLNSESIGIEIDAWGALLEKEGKWYPVKWDKDLGKHIPNLTIKPIENVQKYDDGYRGFYGYEKYTDEQIEATRKLLVFFGEKYNIPLDYNSTMFDISDEALGGKAGVWSHTSYRTDMTDVHPQPELIKMLKSLV